VTELFLSLALKISHQEVKILGDFPLASEIEKLKLKFHKNPAAIGIPLCLTSRASSKKELLPAL